MNYMTMIIDGLKRLSERQDVVCDTHGNLSIRINDGRMLIKPSGIPYERVRQCDVSCVDITTGFLLYGAKPSVDAVHHRTIYMRNENVKSICHTHSPYATVMSVVCSGCGWMQCYTTEQADYFGGAVKVLQYEDLYSWGNEAARCSFDNHAMLLANHGALVVGSDMKTVVDRTIALEIVSKKNFLIRSLSNGNVYVLDSTEAMKWHDRYVNRYGQKIEDDIDS